MNIIWIAPPAAGKGTYSSLLKEKYGFNHISAGDALREQVSLGTEIGKEVKEIIEKTGATSMKDMGKVMKACKEEIGASADGKAINEVVKEILA